MSPNISTPLPTPHGGGPDIQIRNLTFTEALVWIPVFMFEAIVIIAANVLSILVFTSRKYRSKNSSILMTNLAVADLLVGCLATGFEAYAVATPVIWNFHFEFMINVMMDMFTGLGSLFSLTVIALERMHATLFPMQYKFLHSYKYGFVIAFVWILAAFFPCAAFLFPPHVFPNQTLNYAIAAVLCLAVTIIILSYTAIGYKMTRQEAIHQNQRSNQRQVNIIKTLFLVTFLSLVSWLPFQVFILVEYLSNNKYIVKYPNVIIATKFLQYGNSFVNTIVYYFRMSGFRSDLRSIVCNNFQCRCLQSNRLEESRDSAQAERPGDETAETSRYLQSVPSQSVLFEDTKL